MKTLLSKLDFKSIVIILLTIVVLVFVGIYMFSGSKYKSEIKSLTQQNSVYKHQADSIANNLLILKKHEYQDSVTITQYNQQIINLDNQISIKQQALNNAINSLNTIQTQLQQTQNVIQNLENNPIKRTGSNLINSLKKQI